MIGISLLTVFIIAYFLHLTARVPVFAEMRLDLTLGIAAFVATLLQGNRDKLRIGVSTSRRLLFFLGYIILSLPLVTWPGSVLRMNLSVWIKAAFFFLLVIGAVRTEGQLRWIILVFLGSQAFRVLEPLYLHVTEGYWGDIAYSHVGGAMSGLNRLSGSPYDIVNANQYAWVIVNTVPFLYFLFWQQGKIGKLVFLGLMPVFLWALVLTGSRSGMVSLGVVVIAIVAVSENRVRNFVVALIVSVPVAVYMFSSASENLQTRYLSLIDSSVAGGDTKQGRIDALWRQLGSISYNPLFGNGLGTSGETNRNVLGESSQVTHNMYIEILQECGIVGFALFVSYIVTMVKALRGARDLLKSRGREEDDWLLRLISATLVWIYMDLIYSISCFGISSWEWYFFGGVATVCLVLVTERPDDEPEQETEAEPATVEA